MSKYTQKAIVEVFLKLLKTKSLDKITVKDIIETAGVNRNTFYYHYQDIYDLLEKIFKAETERYRNETSSASTFLEEYERAADHLLANKELIINIYNSNTGRETLVSCLEKAADHFVGRFVRKAAENTKLSQDGIDFITCFYSYAVIGVTLRWVDRKMPDYREKMIRSMSHSFEATIDGMIESYIEEHPEECL